MSTTTKGSHQEEKENGFLVVGLGASAGGIQALKQFFSNVPEDSGLGYVVILHMSPEHESQLAQILQSSSLIPVTQVTGREKIVPNHVYVVPPNQNLAMTDGHVTLTDMIGAEERRSPVDLFFRTLAETNEQRAVSVVLSGTGADGSIGLKRIKEHGGVAFVQDPAEAEYADMPRNAIATGMVDYVLQVREIPAKIISYGQHLNSVQVAQPEAEAPQTDEQALIDIFNQLRVRTGHDFSNYKRATILRRIERRLGLREHKSFADYAAYLHQSPQEAVALMKDLLISVTNFFRDSESIEALASLAVPRILESKGPDDPLRIWVAGCATGEEAYSIAMLFYERISRDGRLPNLQLFATDLDPDAIQTAREGYYKESEVADISAERLRRFFHREASGYRVRRELRESILFAVHNVIKDPPFSHLDLISCRNLLIYLNQPAQKRVLEVFHFALNPLGHLFLGASESIDVVADLFATIDKRHRVFRSRAVPARHIPFPEMKLRPTLPSTDPVQAMDEARQIPRLAYADHHLRLLEQYGPPSVVVNEDYEIVHLSDRAGRYMQIAGGEPSHNLLKIVHPDLRVELRTALYRATNDRINVEVNGLQFHLDTKTEVVNIKVRPELGDADPSRGFILVLFEESGDPPAPTAETLTATDQPVTLRLERELINSRAQLRETVHQYETNQEEFRASNEELQAVNEELRSAAEELETSKEELQSLNEELTTLNQELKIKIEELSLANNNFTNLMNSTNIGTIFLDRRLCVRQFTPAITDTFNLIKSDVGRPLLDITSALTDHDLPNDMPIVMETLQTIEREVHTANDQAYLMRLSPYRTLDDKIDGLILTLFDITELAHASEALRRTSDEMEVRVTERTRELAGANDSLRTEVAERLRAEKARIRLLAQLVNAQEDERRRFALDLHDQLGQQVTTLRLKLEALKERSEKRKQLVETVDELLEILRQVDSDVDFLAWQLRPATLDDLGLAPALSNYVKQWSQHTGIAAEFHSGGLKTKRFSQEIEANLYRIAQEALTNCTKHANCSRANVLLERRGESAVLIVEDNGKGFDTNCEPKSENQWGLIGMRERAALLGGSVEIESGGSEGTTIFVRVPLSALDKNQ